MLSVVVPTYNSRNTIKECLEHIRNSGYKEYEVIVVDCNSSDETRAIAGPYADRVIKLINNAGRIAARQAGINAARGEIVVNVDSDVLIRPDTLFKINAYFDSHKEVDVVTGLLSKDCPDNRFFSQYKNLYMNYIFRRLPERVTFIYGSIYAARKAVLVAFEPLVKIADDTALGQQLVSCGKQIAFLPDLEVAHLKKYNIFSFILNDFRIPFDWAHIFIRYKGWKELLSKRVGYAHSPKRQLASVILAQLILAGIVLPPLSFLFFIWLILNLDFIIFLKREKGVIFALASYVVTFFDHVVMGIGIICGFFSYFFFRREGRP
ncbi:MAG: glycosyltransferase family 2 protein [Candidatus Omnitrophota bacterium]